MINRNIEHQNILENKDIEKINATSIELLENTGVEFLHEEALKIFKDHGVKVEDNRVYLTADIIEKMLNKAPSSFTLHARNPENNMVIGKGSTITAPGYGAPFVTDLDNGRRRSQYKDYVDLTKLASESDNIDVLGGVIVEPNDISEDLRHAKMFFAAAKYSDKCLMGSALGGKKAKECLEMASILFDEDKMIDDKPVLITLINTNSPLKYDNRMLDAMITYSRYNQILAITSGAMAGTTAPMSLAGTLVQENVEIIAGIVLTQLINPGTPVLYGPGSSITDMRTAGTAIGSPEYAKLIGAGSQLARYYDIPCRASGSLTDSLTVDNQAGFESMLTYLSGLNNGVHFMIHSAGILEGFMSMSYEKFIVDDEIMGMVNEYQSGIEVNEETMAADIIAEVGPKGYYIETSHTLEHMRDFRQPYISNRSQYISEEDIIPISKKANKKWKSILADFEAPYIDPIIEKKLKDYIKKL